MRVNSIRTILLLPAIALLLSACQPPAMENDRIALVDSAATPYAAAATVLPTAPLFFTSGSVPLPLDASAPVGSPERYGNTYRQALSIFERHRKTLASAGLSLRDVLHARAYVVADPASGEFDWAGWNRAFTETFGALAHKPTRTSIGITRLGNPDFLIEVELVAAYPEGLTPPAVAATNPHLAPMGRRDARINTAMTVSGNAPLYFTSGMLADQKNPDAPFGDREQRGDMVFQATSALQKLEANLRSQGLTFRDVVFLRAMLFPDPLDGMNVDFAGWNQAYSKFFNTPENPHKPTRTTFAAPGFNAFNALIEIEVYAAFPDGRGAHHAYDMDSQNMNIIANGSPDSFLSAGMAVARHTGLTFVSGAIGDTTQLPADADMKAHALSALATLAGRLEAAGLGFEDVIQLRAYLNVGDDFRGNFGLWNEAYGQYFNNEANPHKPVRTALPVVGLPGGSLIEIEVLAAADD